MRKQIVRIVQIKPVHGAA